MEILGAQSVVVTGAASGIGRAIATAFIDAGASVLLCDVRYRAIEAVAWVLGDRAICRSVDVSDEHQVERAMAAARAAFGTLDIVVNCAGFDAIAPLTGLTDDRWRSGRAATLNGVLHGVKHGARHMLEQGRGGVIINISPPHGWQSGEEQAAYCGVEAGVDILTRCGALELGHGIRVVGIAPGRVDAEEIAAAAVFLASDRARSINGETIALDGATSPRAYRALLADLRRPSSIAPPSGSAWTAADHVR